MNVVRKLCSGLFISSSSNGPSARSGLHNLIRRVSAQSLSRITAEVNVQNKVDNKINYVPQRSFHKSLLEIRKRMRWVKPKRVLCIRPEKTGDLASVPLVDRTLPPAHFLLSKEYESAPDTVKRVVSLQFQPRNFLREAQTSALVDKVRRHSYDEKSVEAKIARWTVFIRRMQIHCEAFPRDAKATSDTKELVDFRKKRLKQLRNLDYKRFEWLLEQLDLLYKPHPEKYIRIERKASIKRLAEQYVNNLKEKRLNAYKETLESRKSEFLSRKVHIMKSITAEEAFFGIEPSFSEDEISKLEEEVMKIQQEKSSKENVEDVKMLDF